MSVYNEDELTAPKWMNEEFFKTVLKKYENHKDVEVSKLAVSPASMKGDHYASIMFRAKVDYKSSKAGPMQTKSLIVKTLPDEGPKREIFMATNLFETEIDMYTKILPKIEEILAQHNAATQFGPRILYYALHPNKIIVLEDLCELGYDLVRRALTADELKAIYSKLAKLHAVSFVLGQSEEHQQLMAKQQHGIFNHSMTLKREMIASGIDNFIDLLSSYQEFDMYLPKIRELQKDMFSECQKLYRACQLRATGEILVMNHGDFHLKNLMFKFSEKINMQDFIMVDFQVSVFGPSCIDLMYSTFMLMSPKCRLEQRSELMHHYFEQFADTLKLIKFAGPIPKYADIQMAIIRNRYFSLFLLSTLLPFAYSKLMPDPEQSKNIGGDDFLSNNAAFSMFYRNPAYIEEVRKLLPIFLNAGYLD